MLVDESLFAALDEHERKEIVRAYFHFRCVRCGQTAFEVHEIVPRSHGKGTLAFANRVILCHNCHDWVHTKGVSKLMMKYLRYLRQRRIETFYGKG